MSLGIVKFEDRLYGMALIYPNQLISFAYSQLTFISFFNLEKRRTIAFSLCGLKYFNFPLLESFGLYCVSYTCNNYLPCQTLNTREFSNQEDTTEKWKRGKDWIERHIERIYRFEVSTQRRYVSSRLSHFVNYFMPMI